MSRRRKWRAPNNPTPQARQVWTALFPREPWPKGWRVAWAGFMRGALGLCIYRERRILLSHGDHSGPRMIRHCDSWTIDHATGQRTRSESPRPGPVDTLLHEFVHVRCGYRLRHGKEFTALENNLRARLGMEPRA